MRAEAGERLNMRIAIIGGTGHIGSYLTPMLAEAGHSVICVCRGTRQPYREHAVWSTIEYLRIDRSEEEREGTFGNRIADLGAEAVIDLTCYYPDSAKQLVNALRGGARHLLHCGTIWVHGRSGSAPTTEDEPRQPFGDYGMRKAAIEALLLKQSEADGVPVTVVHPGHLVGPGWAPINPAGNFNVEVFAKLSRGEEVLIPNSGSETLHHVHAEDVARAFLLAVENRAGSVGQSFHAVSAAAMTMRWYAEQMAAWFGQPARLVYLPWNEWKRTASSKDVAVTEDHLRHSPNCSIEKARKLLGFQPVYSSIAAIQESVTWLRKNGAIS
jgi:nucleoside-diphosphate-sugar epimerase